MFTLGIDIGSTTSKCVLLKNKNEIIAKSLVQAGTGTDGPKLAFEQIFEATNIRRDDINFIMATGYGRNMFSKADGEISELSAHGKGVYFIRPSVRTIIDIGGQDAKVIQLTEQGRIANFVMNDKCAAGTGRFLEVMAGILQLGISELGDYAAQSEAQIKISSTCTVFAESEVISQLSRGVSLPGLVAGICDSVASRVSALAKRLQVKEDVFMSGGVALNSGVRNSLSQQLDTVIHVVEDVQYMGALGAALAGYEKLKP